MFDEQDKNDHLDDSANMCDFVERDATSEIFFDTMLETTDLLDGEVLMEVVESEAFSEKAMEGLVFQSPRT